MKGPPRLFLTRTSLASPSPHPHPRASPIGMLFPRVLAAPGGWGRKEGRGRELHRGVTCNTTLWLPPVSSRRKWNDTDWERTMRVIEWLIVTASVHSGEGVASSDGRRYVVVVMVVVVVVVILNYLLLTVEEVVATAVTATSSKATEATVTTTTTTASTATATTTTIPLRSIYFLCLSKIPIRQ